MKKTITLFILLFILSIGQMWATTWTVAGHHEILNGSNDWKFDNTANDMTDMGTDGWFGLLVTDKSLSAETYKFKVGKDHESSETYPASDYWLNIGTAGTYNIIYSYHNVSGNAVLAVPFKGWRVIGDAAVFGTSWGTTDTNNDMTKSGTWEYKLVKKNVPLAASTDYGFKVINDDDTYYTADSKVRVDAAGVYDISITVNIVSKAISVTTSLKPSIVGSMNSWNVHSNPLIDGSTNIELTAGNTYDFLVRYGGTDYRNNGTITSSACWGFWTDGDYNCNITASVTGTYQFGWDHATKQLTVIYPDDTKATLTKNRYIYFDARVSDWKSGNFVARFKFLNYLNRKEIASIECDISSKLEDWVYYAAVPNNDSVGCVLMERLNPDNLEVVWDRANAKYAFERSNASQNCLTTPSEGYNNITLSWETTYCPIKETCTINDNGTVTYGGNGTESTPFLVEKGTKVKVSATSTNYIEDGNMTTKYNFYKDSESQQDGTGTTYEFTASSTASTTHQINVNGYNHYNSTSSSNKFSTLLYYQTVNCYNVSYNANSASSGTVPAATTKYKQGDDISVLGNTGSLIREGYLFSGWNTKADGSGTHFDAGGTLSSISKDTVLYADWVTMVKLYPTSGEFVDFALTSFTDQSKALYINKAYFAEARPGNRIKIDGPDASVKGDAKFFFGDYYVNHVPGSDFRQVPTGSDVLPVYIYLTQEMIDYIKTHDLRIYGENMTVNRVELEVGRAGEFQPDSTIWMGEFTVNDLSTLELLIDQLDVNWSHYDNMIIYHNAGTKDYSFNVRTNWEESGIISFWKDKNHITQEKNFTVVDLVHSNASTVIGATPDRLFIQRDDHSGDDRTPFTITSIVLEKSNTATAGSTWSDATWSQGHAPTTDECAVITAPMTVNVTDAKAGRVLIDQSSSNTGKLTIQPNKGLDVRLTVKKTTDGSTLETTSPADLVLESSSSGNASLVFTNDDNAATVQMYSKANIEDEETWNWQFMGTPFTSANALYSYYGSYLYAWNAGGWDVVPNGGTMTPFTGYCITQDAATTYVMDGTLNPNDDVEITIPASKEFVMANSWTAPISVCNFTATTLPLANRTIYLFNTGFAPKENGDAEQGTAAGTFIAMPINSAIYTGNYLIAPMEGFYVDNRSGSEATITLKYDELVRPSGSHTDIVAGPMHAPRRAQAADDQPAVMKIKATGSRYSERIVILERGDFSAGFDNGWDGKNLNEPGVAPILYALREDGTKDAVSAIPTYEGTVVGFRQGEDNAYTFSFDYDGEDVWYLNDLQELQSTLISEENRYAFTSSASDSEARFIISATPIHKTPTGMETVTGDGLSVTGVRKILINNHLYIIKNGRLYGADGRLVK